MRENIYIRKSNEPRWKEITNKSAWVNAMLEKSPPNSIVEKKSLEHHAGLPVKQLGKVHSKLDEMAPKVCPHGADPKFCKYAKPGKECG